MKIFDGDVIDYILPYIKDELVFDIGGHIGETAKRFKEGGAAKVISVEPQEDLIKNKNYENIEVLNNCVSDKDDELINFYLCKISTSISSCREDWLLKRHIERKATVVQKRTITLDSLIRKYGLPKYIKIDVEGYEDKVLSGLSSKIPLLSFEYTQGFREVFVKAMEKIDYLGFKKATTFLKQKEKQRINGKKVTVWSYRIVNTFGSFSEIIRYFDHLKKRTQGDILIET